MIKFLAILPLLALIGCASTPPPRTQPIAYEPKPEPKPLPRYLFQKAHQYIGPAPTVSPDTKLLVDIGNQNFHYYENGNHIRSGVISSGTRGHPTPRGVYRAGIKDRNKKSGLYPKPNGGANMHYAIQIRGDYFLHEGYLPGHPASHGCVRVWTEDAKFLFKRVNRGDKIVVI
jgi:lipoprotein-anchoring transpeptidase ErfK/SrfK